MELEGPISDYIFNNIPPQMSILSIGGQKYFNIALVLEDE